MDAVAPVAMAVQDEALIDSSPVKENRAPAISTLDPDLITVIALVCISDRLRA